MPECEKELTIQEVSEYIEETLDILINVEKGVFSKSRLMECHSMLSEVRDCWFIKKYPEGDQYVARR